MRAESQVFLHFTAKRVQNILLHVPTYLRGWRNHLGSHDLSHNVMWSRVISYDLMWCRHLLTSLSNWSSSTVGVSKCLLHLMAGTQSRKAANMYCMCKHKLKLEQPLTYTHNHTYMKSVGISGMFIDISQIVGEQAILENRWFQQVKEQQKYRVVVLYIPCASGGSCSHKLPVHCNNMDKSILHTVNTSPIRTLSMSQGSEDYTLK